MQVKFTGSVHYANGDPIPNVAVRIFDKDTTGEVDDDLTVIEGVSDEQGRFTLTYEPLRYLDYHSRQLPGGSGEPEGDQGAKTSLTLPDLGDLYLPYLKFNYTYNQAAREHTATLGPFQDKFYLPVSPAASFLPSVNGFKFPNCFSGYFLPYSTPGFINRKVPGKYGLCGGMCAAAYDYALAGRQVPQVEEVPRQGSRLQRYLFRRQMDSLGGLGQEAIKVAKWTSLPEDTLLGTYRRTAGELAAIQGKLDDGNPVVLALIYEHASSLKELSRVIFNNHQVLAYGYQVSEAGRTKDVQAGGIRVHIYDPNLPGRDDVDLYAVPVPLGDEDSPDGNIPVKGFMTSQVVGGMHYRHVRGFFEMPYMVVEPPEGV